MVEYRTGAKAGLRAGLISEVARTLAEYLLLQSLLDKNVTFAFNIIQLALVLASIVTRIIGDVVLGVIFAVVHKKYLKEQSLQIRGLLFGAVLWLINTVVVSLINAGTNYVGTGLDAIPVGLTFATSLFFGYLLGHFYGTLSMKEEEPVATTPPDQDYAKRSESS